jgi:hypothetical protein
VAKICRGLCIAVVALALGGPSARAAGVHTQRLDVGAELVRQQAGGKPWIVNLVLGAQLGMDDGTVPSPIKHMPSRSRAGRRSTRRRSRPAAWT